MDCYNTPSVISGNPGNGNVTYNYTNREGTATYSSSTAPINAGDYTVTATVTQTQNYNVGTDSTDYTIARQDFTPVYGGENGNVKILPTDPVPNGVSLWLELTDKYGEIIPDTEYDLFVNEKSHKVSISDAIENGGNYNITAVTLDYLFL